MERHDFVNCASGGVIQYSISFILNKVNSEKKQNLIIYCDERNHEIFFENLSKLGVEVIKVQISKNTKLNQILWFLFFKNLIAIFTSYDLFLHHNGIYINPFKRSKNQVIVHNVQPLLFRYDTDIKKRIRLNLLLVSYLASFLSCQKIILLNDALCCRLRCHNLYRIWKKKFHFSTKNLGLEKINIRRKVSGKPDGKINLCYVSTFNEYKNHKFLFDNISKIDVEVSLCCLGIDANNRDFQNLLKEYKFEIAAKVIHSSLVVNELEKYDGLLFLSSVENLPKTIFDYASVAKPMFILRTPEIHDVFEFSSIFWLNALDENEFLEKFSNFISQIKNGGEVCHKIADKYVT